MYRFYSIAFLALFCASASYYATFGCNSLHEAPYTPWHFPIPLFFRGIATSISLHRHRSLPLEYCSCCTLAKI